MLGQIWNFLLIEPILNALVGFYKITDSVGWAIVLLTILIRVISIPFTLPSLKSIKKQQELKPELDRIKAQYHDKQKQAEMQMKLFKEHGINPTSGCFSQILMILMLIALFNVIQQVSVTKDVITTITHINTQLYFDFLKLGDTILKTRFFYLDLTKPDPFYITAVLSGILQFIASKMMMPAIEKAEKAAEKTPGKMDDLAYNMQQQSLYMMPIMSVIIGVTLPAGIMLYIITTTLFSIVQNYCINGWGGVQPWINKIKLWKHKN